MKLTQFLGIDPMLDDRSDFDEITEVQASLSSSLRDDVQESTAHRLESIGMLARGVAHDMNNIFAPILNAAQALRARRTPDEFDVLVRSIEANAQRGAELAHQLLDFSRGSAAKSEDVVLQSLIRDLVSLIESTFPKSIKVVAQLPNDLWSIRSQRTELMQVMLNLCVNARDAMPQGGILKIEASNQFLKRGDPLLSSGLKEGAFVRIQVSDTGTGIPKEIQKRIFEPFFTTKSADRGTGLGLSVVSGIVKKHKGRIAVSSELGVGTSFEILLPSIALKREQQTVQGGGAELAPATTVMVVDDEQLVLLTVKTLLGDRGYKVITVRDGFEAIKVLKTGGQKIDLVITDMQMPMLSGWETVSLIRAIDPTMAFVAVSGHVSYLESEFSDDVPFLQKPFTADQLVFSVEQSLAIRRDSSGRK